MIHTFSSELIFLISPSHFFLLFLLTYQFDLKEEKEVRQESIRKLVDSHHAASTAALQNSRLLDANGGHLHANDDGASEHRGWRACVCFLISVHISVYPFKFIFYLYLAISPSIDLIYSLCLLLIC